MCWRPRLTNPAASGEHPSRSTWTAKTASNVLGTCSQTRVSPRRLSCLSSSRRRRTTAGRLSNSSLILVKCWSWGQSIGWWRGSCTLLPLLWFTISSRGDVIVLLFTSEFCIRPNKNWNSSYCELLLFECLTLVPQYFFFTHCRHDYFLPVVGRSHSRHLLYFDAFIYVLLNKQLTSFNPDMPFSSTTYLTLYFTGPVTNRWLNQTLVRTKWSITIKISIEERY